MNAKERKKEVEVEEEEEAQGKERTERTERGFDHRILSECLSVLRSTCSRAEHKKKSTLFVLEISLQLISLSLSNASSRLAKHARSANYFRGRESV